MRNIAKFAVVAALAAAQAAAPSAAYADTPSKMSSMRDDDDLGKKRLVAAGTITALSLASMLTLSLIIDDNDDDNDPAPVSP